MEPIETIKDLSNWLPKDSQLTLMSVRNQYKAVLRLRNDKQLISTADRLENCLCNLMVLLKDVQVAETSYPSSQCMYCYSFKGRILRSDTNLSPEEVERMSLDNRYDNPDLLELKSIVEFHYLAGALFAFSAPKYLGTFDCNKRELHESKVTT